MKKKCWPCQHPERGSPEPTVRGVNWLRGPWRPGFKLPGGLEGRGRLQGCWWGWEVGPGAWFWLQGWEAGSSSSSSPSSDAWAPVAQPWLWWKRVSGEDGKSCLELLECEMSVDPTCSTQRLAPGLWRGWLGQGERPSLSTGLPGPGMVPKVGALPSARPPLPWDQQGAGKGCVACRLCTSSAGADWWGWESVSSQPCWANTVIQASSKEEQPRRGLVRAQPRGELGTREERVVGRPGAGWEF